MRVLLTALAFCLFISSAFAHKIIYMISPPRSMSVAFTRMMQARGDFEIYHEPSQSPYDRKYLPELTAEWFREGTFLTFEEVKNALIESSQNKNAFAKEMSFAVEEFLLQDIEFVKNPDVHFVFLIRNPHGTCISLYQRFGIWQNDGIRWLGYQAEYEIFQFVKEHAVHPPLIIQTEELYNRPEETVKAFCRHVGIPFFPHSMHWADLGIQFTGETEWHELKVPSLTHHWHGEAIHSTGFGKPRSYEVDEQNQPTFSEIQNENDRQTVKETYLLHLPYYKKLLEERDYFLELNHLEDTDHK